MKTTKKGTEIKSAGTKSSLIQDTRTRGSQNSTTLIFFSVTTKLSLTFSLYRSDMLKLKMYLKSSMDLEVYHLITYILILGTQDVVANQYDLTQEKVSVKATTALQCS